MGLALVMVKEHTRRAVHLRHDHTLGAIDDEGTVLCHERNIAHIDFLLFDIAQRAGTGFFIHVPNHQAQRYLQLRGIGQAPLAAFLNVVFRAL